MPVKKQSPFRNPLILKMADIRRITNGKKKCHPRIFQAGIQGRGGVIPEFFYRAVRSLPQGGKEIQGRGGRIF
jgi:hypothetical protein